jgi:hypothetical protein
MTDDFYKKAFDAALSELTSLEDDRERIAIELETVEGRMEKVRQAALGLLSLTDTEFQQIKDKYPRLFADQLDPRLGITDAIRQVLKASDDMMTTHQIRDAVFQISPAIAAHKNPIASVAAILRRLMDNNDVASGIFQSGKTVYGWIGSEDGRDRLLRWFQGGEGEEMWKRTQARRASRSGGVTPPKVTESTKKKD